MTLVKRTIDLFRAKAPMEERPALGGARSVGDLFGSNAGTGGAVGNMAAYGNVSWLFASVSRIAQDVAATNWRLYRGVGNERREVLSHPVLDLLALPTPFTTREEFIEGSQQHLDLCGEFFWLVITNGAGRPVELWPLRPDRVKPIPHPQDFIAGYIYKIGNDSVALRPDQVIFTKMPSPLDPYRGMGPVGAMIYDLGNEKAAAQYQQSFFANSAEPGGVIEFASSLSETAFDEFVSRWRRQHQGTGNAHRVAVIENGKWVNRAFSQRDMQFHQLRMFSRDVIVGGLGIPQAMLGVSENINRANAEAAEVMYGRHVLRPRLRRLRGTFNEHLIPMYQQAGLWLDYDDPTPEDRTANLAEAQIGYEKGFLTRNEARELIGQPATDEAGDEFKGPASPFMLGWTPDYEGPSVQKVLPTGDLEGVGIGTVNKALTPLERLNRGWERRLAKERGALIKFVAQFFKGAVPFTKIMPGDLDIYDWDWWAKYGPDVVKEIDATYVTFLTNAGVEPIQAEVMARQYAESRGAELLKVDGDVNVVAATRQRVNVLVARTIDRGDSLGTLQKALREDFAFSKRRAVMVARTETATALGEGSFSAAKLQDRNEKSWISQGDGEVSDACFSNEAAGWIPIDDLFPTGLKTIPQHPNCRCTVIFRGEPLASEGRSIAHQADEEHRSAAKEGGAALGHREVVRCASCDKLLQKDIPAGVPLRCPRCKETTTS